MDMDDVLQHIGIKDSHVFIPAENLNGIVIIIIGPGVIELNILCREEVQFERMFSRKTQF